MAQESSILDALSPKVFLLTACHAGRRSGMIATWITSASLIPDDKRIVVALSPRNFTTQTLLQSARFVVHLLCESQAELVARFGLHSSRDVDKFGGLKLSASSDEIPRLEGTCGWAEVRVESHMDVGDRLIVAARVLQERVEPERKPLYAAQLDQRLDADTLQALAEKNRRDIELDRGLRRSGEGA